MSSLLHDTVYITTVAFTIRHVFLWWSCTPSITPSLMFVRSFAVVANVLKFDFCIVVVTIHKMHLLRHA